MKTPLAWQNLTHDRRRVMLAAGGIGFASLLMFMQLGFQGALYDSTVQLIDRFNADLIMVSKAKSVLTARETFLRRRLLQASADPDVESAWPLYLEVRLSAWKNIETGQQLPIRVVAYDPRLPVLNISEVGEHAGELLLPGTVLFDEKSKSDFGDPQPGDVSELAGQRVRVVGLYSLGTDFADDGNVIISDVNYREMFYPPLAQSEALANVDFGLLKVRNDADLYEVMERLHSTLPTDVMVYTKADYIRKEQDFWSKTTPIGYVFTFGTILGFIVGVIICYQILYADISDHLPEYATLKAMGYANRFFIKLVLQESLLLSVMGFLPGLVVSLMLYTLLGSATGLLLHLSLGRAAAVLALTIAMCVVSGALAMRRVLTADPAELFK